jgi:predicted Zn-dependent peptidase/Tfp pilus assembly protein PilF
LSTRRHLAAAAAIAVGLAGPAWAQAPAAEPKPVGLAAAAPLMRWDPQVRYGRLPNGLRYAVQHVANPKGAVSIRLGVAAGSYQEADDEGGAAHVLEHLAFEATRSFGENQAALTFAPMKMAFGPDRNAAADLAATTYQADLPTQDPKAIAAALSWLRDAADGLSFTESAVGRARAAALAELAARDTPLGRFRDRVSGFEDAGLRSAARPVTGTRESLAGLTPGKLKGFYDRWYRPQEAVVVMVGDLPAEAMEEQVRKTFADWTGRGAPPPPPAVPPPPPATGLETLSVSVASATPVVRICRVARPDPADAPPPQKLRTLLLREVWRAVLQRRLNVLATRADAPFKETNVSTDVRPDSNKTCIAIAPARGGEAQAIALVQGEFARFAAGGASANEIDNAVVQLRAIIRGAIGASPSAAGQAGELLQRALDDMPQLEPREGLRAFDVLLEGLPPAAVKAQFDRDWSGRGPLVTVAGPAALSDDAIHAAMATPAPVIQTAAVQAPKAGPRPANTPERQAALARAEQALSAGEFKEARRDFDGLVGRDRSDADALAGRGRVWAAMGKADPALKDFAAALAIDPANAIALNARGNLYVAINQAERAIPDFDAALAVNPRDDVVLYNRGLAFKQMGRLDAAIRDFDAALAVAPGDPLTFTGKADAYRRLGDLLLAREFYDAALAREPRNPAALDGRGQVREALGDAAGGAADRAKARQLDPSLAS